MHTEKYMCHKNSCLTCVTSTIRGNFAELLSREGLGGFLEVEFWSRNLGQEHVHRPWDGRGGAFVKMTKGECCSCIESRQKSVRNELREKNDARPHKT